MESDDQPVINRRPPIVKSSPNSFLKTQIAILILQAVIIIFLFIPGWGWDWKREPNEPVNGFIISPAYIYTSIFFTLLASVNILLSKRERYKTAFITGIIGIIVHPFLLLLVINSSMHYFCVGACGKYIASFETYTFYSFCLFVVTFFVLVLSAIVAKRKNKN